MNKVFCLHNTIGKRVSALGGGKKPNDYFGRYYKIRVTTIPPILKLSPGGLNVFTFPKLMNKSVS